MLEASSVASKSGKTIDIDSYRADHPEWEPKNPLKTREKKIGGYIIVMKTQPELEADEIIKTFFLEGKFDLAEEMDKARSKAEFHEDALDSIRLLAAKAYGSESDEKGTLESEPIDQLETPSNVISIDRRSRRK